MSMEFERKPLSVDVFPANLQVHVQPDAPAKMKMMAARGMVPAGPDQQVQLLYQLHFDESVSEMAIEALGEMPEQVLIPVLEKIESTEVLDWIAEQREEVAVSKAIILNQYAHDATVYRLAATASAEICEIIANNQVRVLRSPAIIEALYKNSKARMATVDKLIELAQRNEVDLSGLPGVVQALKSGAALHDKEGLSDEAFSDLLGEQDNKAEEEEKALKALEDKKLTRSQREALDRKLAGEDEESDDGEEGEEEERATSLLQQITDMNIAQKIRLATVGSREAIKILVRDSNKLVHMAAVQSPRMRVGDVRRLASNKGLPEGVIKYIASNRDWTRHYDVLSSLTMNPKTPLSDVLTFMNHLRARELRQLTRSRDVSRQVSRMAKQLLTKRGM